MLLTNLFKADWKIYLKCCQQTSTDGTVWHYYLFFWIRTGNLYICKDNSGIFFFPISIPWVDGYGNFFLTEEKLLKSLRPRIYDSSNRRSFPTYKHTITKEYLIINKQSSLLCLKTSQTTNFSWPFIGMVDGDYPIDQLRPNMNPI